MKNVTRLVLVLAVCLAIPALKIFAGSFSDSIYSYTPSTPSYVSQSSSVNLPAGAFVSWSVAATGFTARASISGSGDLSFNMYVSGSNTDYAQDSLPNGGTVYYSMYTEAYDYDSAEAGIYASW